MAFHPSWRVGLLLLAAIILSLSACKKETEIQLKEVDKMYSWKEDRHFLGFGKVILGIGQDASSLFLHTPGILSQLSPGVRSQPYFENLNGRMPSDVAIRVPLAATVVAFPIADTVVTVAPYADAVNPEYSANVRLHKLDPQAITYRVTVKSLSGRESQFAAINRNNYLLLSYRRPGAAVGTTVLRLVLARITLTPGAFQRVQLQSQIIDFPTSALSGSSYPYISQITAIDDYFLVSKSDGGLFKVTENGTVRLVDSERSVKTAYAWQGKLYAQSFSDKLLVSADAGETWTTYTNTPSFLSSSRFQVLGDSLIGYTDSFNQLYSLRWNGGTGRIRELKNDGMGEAAINDIKQLGDTVYVGTTSGLFKRPAKAFFESKAR
ncbi:hypothetical protein [Hymenobacter sp. UYCo722]|uniref:hypothetical protein n=1 Tax=Hymenobacter sp. UYCo722 TaxID=3156335 RepID=UPI0033966E03